MGEKKRIIVVGVIIFLLVAVGSIMLKKENPKISTGKYLSDQGSWSFIEFDVQNRSFVFAHSLWLSYHEIGRFEYQNGKVVAIEEERGENERYVFKIIDEETVSFLKNESASTDLADGTMFRLSRETG